METIIATSFEEARRSRLAQFGGKARMLELAGAVVTGTVHSVREVESSGPPAWRVILKRTHRTNATLLGPALKLPDPFHRSVA
jgi:hypothetical protein